MPVSRKPRAICRARADPAVPAGASSETAVENWAESATTVTPHTIAIATVIAGRAPKANPAAMALVPDTAIAAIVSVVRPRRSARRPARTQPMPPEATTTNAAALAAAGSCVPAAAKLAARNSGTQVHIA